MYRYTRKSSDFSPQAIKLHHKNGSFTTNSTIPRHCRLQIAAGVFIALYLPPEKCHPRLDKKTNTKRHPRLDKKTNTKRHPRLDRGSNTITMKFKNANVLITGGASGIGRIMGRMALEKEAKCYIIWDINAQGIESTCKEFSKYGNVRGYVVDVSDNEAIKAAYRTTVEECGDIDILINNAGIITSNKTFDKQTESEIVRTMQINTLAPMFVTLAMLPDMLKRDKGHICNIASAGGMLANPKMSVYTASKWAAIGWSDSVRIELQQMKSNVHVTTVAPFYIRTGMFEGVNSWLIPILPPEYVCKRVIRAIERNTIFRGIPFGSHFIRFWQTVLPTCAFDLIFGKVVGLYHAMDDFTGRK